VQTYLQAVVDQGDLAQTDYAHMDAIMVLGDVAQRLQTSEDAGVWVRNWRWGLTQIVALYAERALYNASTWISRGNGVWIAGQERFELAETYRTNYRPDSYMTTLIDSRCDIIGVYNAIYEPNYDVPVECCARVREFYDLDSQYRGRDSEIPIPDICLETITIQINDDGFSPSEVRLSVGQRVKFINKTSQAQQIVGGEPGTPDTDALNTGSIAPNGVYETQFNAEMEFGFFSSTQPDEINGGSISVGDN
jgi:plastocyanin